MTEKIKVVSGGVGETKPAPSELENRELEDPILRIAEAQWHEFYEKLKGAEAQKATAIEAVERTYGPNADIRKIILKHLNEADRDRERIKGELGMRGPNRRYVPAVVYVAVSLLVALFVAPLDKFIFDVALPSPEIVNWMVAFCLGLMLFVFAHFNGIALREMRSERRRRVNWKNLILFIFWTALLVLAILTLAVARWRFSLMGGAGSLADLVDGAKEHLRTVGVWEFLKTALSDPAAQMLTAINAFGVILAMFLAFTSHDSDEDYDYAIRERDRLRAELNRLDKARARQIGRIERQFASQIRRLTSQVAIAGARVRELRKGAIEAARL
jgi:hypothetical protein